ncbi:hypothetical protein TWF102_002133, partial [Orbilia oligospora]
MADGGRWWLWVLEVLVVLGGDGGNDDDGDEDEDDRNRLYNNSHVKIYMRSQSCNHALPDLAILGGAMS